MEPDEVALWRRVPAGDSSAIEALARRYRSIAIALARTMQGRGFGDDDLIDEANQALREAITQVDQGRLATFKAFAKTIVHRRLVDLHRKLGPYSAHECQQAAEFEAAKSDLYRASREEPTDGETYDHLGWSASQRRNHSTARDRVNEHHEALETIMDGSSDDPARICEQQDYNSRLHAAIGALGIAQRQVICRRYLSIDPPSQKSLATELGWTEHRVRTLEAEAMGRLRRMLEGASSQTT